ncbi:MAG: 4-hydroxyphenylacetate 3-monooxygenase, oxygenase component [Chloroflexota bacterium]
MGATTGAGFLRRVSSRSRDLWHRGERVDDPTVHPAFKNCLASLAELYDIQWKYPDEMLYESPTTGEKVGLSFLIARSPEDIRRVSRMMKRWADHHFGFMGRTPDYLNRAVTAYAAGADFLGYREPAFAANIRRYYEYVRDNDLCLTHTLINPQANRSVGPARQADPFLAARVAKETDGGIVIRGARMLATLPAVDEIMVFPSTLLRNTEEDTPYCFAVSLPCDTPGLRFICRETVDYGRSHFDHPLGSRFDEMDAVVVFHDVFVPWERVFIYREVDRANQAYAATGAIVGMAHQVAVKNIAKTEFFLGLASLIVDTIAIEQFQHVQEKVAEIWVYLEAMRALLRAAEADAAPDEWGVYRPAWPPLDAARNLYPKIYPRMVEIIQQLCASGIVAIPTEADVRNPELAEDIRRYFQAARAEALERIPIFRLAWDAALSAFAARQVQYERFFFGDPVRMAGMVFQTHDRAPYMERVREFLARAQVEAGGDDAGL